MFVFYVSVLILINGVKSQFFNCSSYDASSSSCFGCGANHYQQNMATGFSAEKCLEKKQMSACGKKTILISQKNSCPECGPYFDKIYPALGICLKEESAWAADCDSVDMEIVLLDEKNSLHSTDSDEALHLFRRTKISLVLKPLFCEELAAPGCKAKSEKVEIILRSSKYLFFVALSLTIQNIIFEGIDLTYKGSDKSCLQSSDYCCQSIDNILLARWNQSNCGVRGITVNEGEKIPLTGLFNIEPVFENPDIMPRLEIFYCGFRNFFLLKEAGFGGLVKFNTKFPSKLKFSENSIDSFLTLGSLIGVSLLPDLVKNDPFYKFSRIDINSAIETAALTFKQLAALVIQNCSISNRYSAAEVELFSFTPTDVLISVKESVISSLQFTNIRFDKISDSNSSNFIMLLENLAGATIQVENISIGSANNISLYKFKYISSLIMNNIRVFQSQAKDSQYFSIENCASNISNLTIENCSSLQKSSFVFNISSANFVSTLFSDIKLLRCENFLYYFKKVNIEFSNLLLGNCSFVGTFISAYDSSISVISSKVSQFSAISSAKSIIFFLSKTNLSVKSSNLFLLSASIMFDLRDAPLVQFNNAILEKIVGFAYFFTTDSSYRNFSFTSSYWINSAIEKLCFWNVISLFSNYRPAFTFSDSKVYNLDILAAYFAAFSKIDVSFIGCEWINVTCSKDGVQVRFWYFGPQSNLRIVNSTFQRNGFTYMPSSTQYFANYIAFLGAFLNSAVVQNSKFINDEKVNLISGFLALVFTVSSIEVSDCSFEAVRRNPLFTYHGVIMQGAPLVKFLRNSVRNLNCPPRLFLTQYHMNGVVVLQGEDSVNYILNKKTALIENNTFVGCKCYQAGALSISNYMTTFRNNVFTGNIAEQGGSLSIYSTSKVVFQNNSFDTSNANLGGAFKAFDIISFESRDCTITNSWAGNTGGIWINNIRSATLINLIATNTSSMGDAGFLAVYKTNFFLYNAYFSNISATKSGGVFLIDLFSSISIITIKVKSSFAEYGGVGAILSAENFTLMEAEFEGVSSSQSGAVLFFDSLLNVWVDGLTVSNSTSLSSGVIFIKTMENDAYFGFNHLTCIFNKAVTGSCLYFNSPAKLSIKSANLSYCEGILLKFSWSVKTLISISDAFLTNNTSLETLLFFQGVNINITRINIKGNRIKKSLVYVKVCDLQLNQASMKYNEYVDPNNILAVYVGLHIISSVLNAEKVIITNSLVSGDFIAIQSDSSSVRISETFTSQTRSILKSIFYFEKCSVTVAHSSFENNIGSCLNTYYGDIDISHAIFVNNQVGSRDIPSDLLIQGQIESPESAILSSIISVRTLSGLSIKTNGIDFLNMSNICIVGDSSAHKALEKSQDGLLLLESAKVILGDSIFSSLSSFSSGSALKSLNFEKELASFEITNSLFENCSSSMGGAAVYVSNTRNVSFSDCRFIKNRAIHDEALPDFYSGVGGCGMISCFSSDCVVNFLSTYFEGNKADYHSPLFVMNISHRVHNVTLANNSDLENFTSSFTVYPLEVKLQLGANIVLNPNLTNKSLTKISIIDFDSSEKFNYVLVSSGVPFNLTFEITDKLGQDLIFEDSSRANIEIDDISSKAQISNGVGRSEDGRIFFAGVVIHSMPGTGFRTKLTLIISKYIGLNSDPIIIQKYIYFKMRNCVQGEIIKPDLTCFTCQAGTYSSIDPMDNANNTGTQKCNNCPSEALCPGGWQIFPKPGFWRANNISLNFIPCLVPAACIGPGDAQSDSEVNQMGRCEEGHQGNLCHTCSEGRGRLSTTSTCEDCSLSKMGYILRFIGISILMMLYSIGGSYVYSLQSSNTKNAGFLFVYIKVMITFSQIVNLLTSLKFDWVVSSFKDIYTSGTGTISFSFEQLLLNDCIIQTGSDGYLEPVTQFKMKSGIIVLLPLFLAFLSSFVYALQHVIYRCKNNPSEKRLKAKQKLLVMRIFACLVISIFIFQPIIIKNSFNLLNCTNLDPNKPTETFISSNPNVKCWESDHVSILLFAFAPGVIVWGISFPLILIYVLRTQQILKKTLNLKKMGSSIKEYIVGRDIIEKNPSEQEPEKIFIRQKISVKIKQEKGQVTKITKSDSNNLNREESLAQSSISEIATPVKITNRNSKKGLFYFLLKSNVFKFLHHGFKDHLTFWEGTVFLKKFALSMLVNLTTIIGLEVVNLITFALLFASLLLHIKYRPFVLNELNFQEFISEFCCIIVYACVIALSTGMPGNFLPGLASFLVTLSFLVVLGTSLFLIIRAIYKDKLIFRVLRSFATIMRQSTKSK